jgi:hypothetical protein
VTTRRWFGVVIYGLIAFGAFGIAKRERSLVWAGLCGYCLCRLGDYALSRDPHP